MSHIEKSEKLFEVIDVFGHQVSTTQQYWDKIMLIKHRELDTTIEEVSQVLEDPNKVRRSIQDPHIKLFYKSFGEKYFVIVVKYINIRGFIVTMYKTSKLKQKGEIVWSK